MPRSDHLSWPGFTFTSSQSVARALAGVERVPQELYISSILTCISARPKSFMQEWKIRYISFSAYFNAGSFVVIEKLPLRDEVSRHFIIALRHGWDLIGERLDACYCCWTITFEFIFMPGYFPWRNLCNECFSLRTQIPWVWIPRIVKLCTHQISSTTPMAPAVPVSPKQGDVREI